MKIKDIQRKEQREKKISISIRVSKEISDWMSKNNISPTKLFITSVKELMKSK